MIDNMLSMITGEYRLRSLNSGVFHKLVVRGMNIEINSYEAEGLGRVSTMCASGLGGLIKRDVLVISPMEQEAPVITYERVKALGKDTLMLTKYDIEKEPECVKKVGKKKQSEGLDREAENYLSTYLEEVKQAPPIKVKERKEQLEELVASLIQGYQLISDIFLATYGMKVTEKLYHEVLFGSRENQ